MRRYGVFWFMAGLILNVTSFALAADGDHPNRPTSHDAVHSSHNADPAHGAVHTATAHDGNHTGHHHEGDEQGHTHTGHAFLRWIHKVLGRFGHTHLDAPHSNATEAPHAGMRPINECASIVFRELQETLSLPCNCDEWKGSRSSAADDIVSTWPAGGFHHDSPQNAPPCHCVPRQ